MVFTNHGSFEPPPFPLFLLVGVPWLSNPKPGHRFFHESRPFSRASTVGWGDMQVSSRPAAGGRSCEPWERLISVLLSHWADESALAPYPKHR